MHSRERRVRLGGVLSGDEEKGGGVYERLGGIYQSTSNLSIYVTKNGVI